MADINDLVIRLDATTEQLRRELKRGETAVTTFERQADRRLKQVDDRFSRMTAGVSRNMLRLAGILGAGAVFRKFVQNTAVQERAVAQLNAAIRSTGATANATQAEMDALSGSLQRYASELQRVSTFGDEAIISSQALLLTFRQIGTDVAPRAQKAILDMATAMGTDLRTATLQIGKALNDPIAGVTALRRSGIQLTESQQELIKSFVDVGDVASAQAIVLEELENQFKGSAEAARNTLGGALKALQNAFGDLFELTGSSSAFTRSLNDLADFFSDLGQEIAFARGELNALSNAFVQSKLSSMRDDLASLSRVPASFNEEEAEMFQRTLDRDSNIQDIKTEIMFLENLIKRREDEQKTIEGYNKRVQESSAAEASAARSKKESETRLKALGKEREKQEKMLERQAERKREYNESLILEIEQLQRLEEAINISVGSHELVDRAIRVENEARRQGFAIGTAEYEQITQQILAREKLKDSIDATIQRREDEQRVIEQNQRDMERILAEPFINASNNVQNEIARMLENWDFSMRGFVNIAKRAGAEATAALVVRPVLEAGVSSVMGGGSGGGAGDLAGTAVSKGLGLTGISSSINAFGASALPSIFGTGAPAGAAIGAMPAGALGGMGIGLSSIALPVAGLAVGAILSSVFKGKRKHPASNFAFDELGDGQAQLFSKHVSTDTASSLAQAVGSIAETLAMAGIDVARQTVQGGVDDGRGFFALGRGELQQSIASGIRFNPNDEQDLQRALGDLTIQLVQVSNRGDELAHVLTNIDSKGRTAEEVLNDVLFALEFDKIGDVPIVLSEVEQAIADLRNTFQEAADTAARLGLEVAKVQQAEQKRIDLMRGQFMQNIAQQIMGGLAPQELAQTQERQRFGAQLRDLRALGATQQEIQMAELLHQVNMSNILGENQEAQERLLQAERDRLQIATDTMRRFERVQQTFSNIIQELTLGALSPLDPVSRLAGLREQVGSLGQRARLGDVDAAEELGQLLPEFVRLSGEINGFNATFEQDRAMAEGLARSTLSTAERQVSLQGRIIEEAQRQTTILQQGFNSLEQALQRFGGGISASQVMAAAGGTNANDAIVRAIQQGGLSESIAHQIIRSAGFTGTIGGGNVQSFFAGNQQANLMAMQDLQRRGIPAFNSGGMVGGTGGVDNNIIRASRGEFVMSNAAVNAIGAPAMNAMNSSRSLPIDFTVVVQALGRVEVALHGVQRTVAAGESMAVEQLAAVRQEVSQINDVASRMAAGI